jgi:antitoxin VapB
MAVAKVFMSGNSQAVRLPKEYRLDADEVEVTRQGDGLFLSPRRQTLERAFELICEMSPEMFEGIRDERSPEDREGL